jgi:hypothetical protein
MEMGKRRYWKESQVEAWFAKKVELANKKAFASPPQKKLGRPTKAQTIRKENTPTMI